jgi:CheY-like chemotaxis protein
LLAGRKLLLADDSATIQKVIDLTFADEGVRVMAVSNGQEALDRILEFAPDIVLADVFMPSPNGYEVCEYVKTNEQLKHIPVVLLVGSFEPFDEAEARRVGADDILTKPFSSIRRLIDRVGALVSSPPAEKSSDKERPTAELPKTQELSDDGLLSTQELEVTTADTMPLLDNYPDEIIAKLSGVDEPSGAVTPSARLESLLNQPPSSRKSEIDGTSEHEGRMEPGITEPKSDSHSESADVLLDLGDIEPAHASGDDFVLDLDDEVAAPVYAGSPSYEAARMSEAPMRAFVEPQVTETSAPAYESSYQPAVQPAEVHSSFAETQEVPYASEARNVTDIEPYEPAVAPEPAPVSVSETSQPATSLSADQLSPEMIDAIARRCVELMSDKVIREIAWEVVPDLAELLIKRQLEENQAK